MNNRRPSERARCNTCRYSRNPALFLISSCLKAWAWLGSGQAVCLTEMVPRYDSHRYSLTLHVWQGKIHRALWYADTRACIPGRPAARVGGVAWRRDSSRLSKPELRVRRGGWYRYIKHVHAVLPAGSPSSGSRAFPIVPSIEPQAWGESGGEKEAAEYWIRR